uniref:Toxin candidate TRINITY_DN31621_c1_g1_i2 n=1 Tax=Pachycerianthus maua TaxID=2736681 RepID=A0A7G7WZ43_9CNID|nr:toxin candidate TRINITY_DN31621_c1_g1_i2 [Pachycerianthus maua]
MKSVVLLALVVLFCSAISPISCNPVDLDELDSSKDLDIMDFERLLAADKVKNELKAKREFLQQSFMDDLIDDLGNHKRGSCNFKDSHVNCPKYKGLCSMLKQIRDNCKKTCEVPCRAPAPPACASSKFGCCWDLETEATGKNQEGCPACKDARSFCMFFKSSCEEGQRSYKYMKTHCPETCGYCDLGAKKKK